MMNNRYLQWFHIVIKQNPTKPKMALPSTKTQTEPIFLELFNRAAADLDKKGEIELERYKKYLFNHE